MVLWGRGIPRFGILVVKGSLDLLSVFQAPGPGCACYHFLSPQLFSEWITGTPLGCQVYEWVMPSGHLGVDSLCVSVIFQVRLTQQASPSSAPMRRLRLIF